MFILKKLVIMVYGSQVKPGTEAFLDNPVILTQSPK